MFLVMAFAFLDVETGCTTANWGQVAQAMNAAAAGYQGQQTGAVNPLALIEGARIVASDGTFLGVITRSAYASDSIGNTYGNYGSPYSTTSIFNQYGEYGGKYSSMSPYNDYTSTPPKIVTTDGRWAYLTTNRMLSPRIDPYVVIAYCKG